MLHIDFTMVLKCENSQSVLPNAAAVWVDPYWTGIWQESTKDGFFRVRNVMKPLKANWASPSASPAKGCCDSIKVHFFRIGKNCDFMYSMAFPLRRAPAAAAYHVFNYNDSDGQSCECDKNIWVTVTNDTVLTGKIPLLELKGPDVDHHTRTVAVGNWIDEAFNDMWPKNKTIMTNPRTYFRDYCCTFFFTDIQKLFDKQGQSHLPPWLGCYSLANALIVNGVPLQLFLKMTINDVFLRIVKCAITPWTMCIREGLFWGDQCLGKSTEDQPFPLSFVPTLEGRVFGRDDCEGRASQAQEMVELFINIYKYVQSNDESAALRRLETCDKLMLAPPQWRLLVKGCVRLGGLLNSKVIESQTVVGEADTAAIHGGSGQVVGHSFGILRNGPRDYMMVENTGWQRRVLPWDGHPLSPFGLRDTMMAGAVNMDIENRLYHKIYMGHDKLFFTKNKELIYGVTPTDIGAGRCVCMSMKQVLQAFCESDGEIRIWPARAGAEHMLEQYMQIQANLPDIRQTLMTPQKTEAEFEKLMESWGVIQGTDLPMDAEPGGLWFKTDPEAWQEHVQNDLRELPLRAHRFMHSILVRID